MTNPLSPQEAAVLASSSYATHLSSAPALDAARLAGGSTSPFDVGASSVFTGVTGLGTISNFGYCAFGRNQRQGECLISVRGTETVSDWLTDGHFSGARGPNGFMVHRGFNNTMSGILPQVKTALTGKNPSAIHLVGHSLGGAVATLLADALKDHAQLYLYTFGAPRAGAVDHASYLTSKLNAQNIFRVYHDTDPVPMVPIFPYGHCPAGRNGYLLKGSGMIISPGAHSMTLYKSNAAGSWNSMQTIPHRSFSLDTVDDVLARAGTIPGGYLSSLLMRLIVRALGMIMELAGMGTGLVLLGAATIADQIAYVISKGIAAVGVVAETLQELVRQILRFLGQPISSSTSFSTAFLKWLLDKLFATIAMMARQATRAL